MTKLFKAYKLVEDIGCKVRKKKHEQAMQIKKLIIPLIAWWKIEGLMIRKMHQYQILN